MAQTANKEYRVGILSAQTQQLDCNKRTVAIVLLNGAAQQCNHRVVKPHETNRVANLAFLKPDFEILVLTQLDFFFIKKSQILSGFFMSERLWLWQSIVWAAYSLQTFSHGSLWPRRVQRIL